jgi:two-component sensor histidine kinase
MINHGSFAVTQQTPRATPWLFLEEIEHRVANEYAMAAASISLAAAGTSVPAVKATLTEAVRRLTSYADVHRSLQLPSAAGQYDLAGYLRSLYESLVRARLSERGISLTLVELNVRISAERCWRIGLIVSELITNSIRHAFRDQNGAITVEMARTADMIHCRVTDTGQSAGAVTPGRGSRIVDALAAELGGQIVRQFGPVGTTVTLSVPADS